jgi:hypothetical protein
VEARGRGEGLSCMEGLDLPGVKEDLHVTGRMWMVTADQV